MASTSLPPTFVATVASLHRVAEQIVSPARKPDVEISLQATPGGYGTPASFATCSQTAFSALIAMTMPAESQNSV